MSEFLRRPCKKPTKPRRHGSYDDCMKLPGKVTPSTVRLPVSSVTDFDALRRQYPCVWSSREELLFERTESSVTDWTEAQLGTMEGSAATEETAEMTPIGMRPARSRPCPRPRLRDKGDQYRMALHAHFVASPYELRRSAPEDNQRDLRMAMGAKESRRSA